MEATEGVVVPHEEIQPASIADHAATFSPEAQKADDEAAPAGETLEQRTERLHHSAMQRREKTGEFTDGKKRVRPSKQFESRVEKVAERKLEPLKAEKTALETTVQQLQAEVDRLKRASAPTEQIQRAEAKVDAADPEPLEDDPKFGGDYAKYLKEQAKWAAREALREDRASEAKSRREQHEKISAEEVVKTFGERVERTRAKYEDFEKVAFGPTRIPSGSYVDAFVMEDVDGPEVLYYLNQQQQAQELDEILRLPVVQQSRRLSAIADRLSSSALEPAAVTTGAVTQRKVKLPPPPPTPVRTEAQRGSDDLPAVSGSLSIAEHKKRFATR